MSIERITNRIALPQSFTAWEQHLNRVMAVLAKVPLNCWQFLVQLLLVASLSFSLARFFWLVFPNPTIPPSAVTTPIAAAPVAAGGSTIDISQLKAISVFGKEAPVVQAPVATQETQAIDSHLNLILMGIIASTDESLARAIITSSDSSDIYAVGNALPAGNGVVLSKIMSDRVIINNNGQPETVWLYQNNPNSPPISQSFMGPPASSNSGSGSSGAQYSPDPQNHAPAQSAPPRAQDNGRKPENLTDRGVAEVSRNLSDVVAMSIYREGGKVIGYKIRPGRDSDKFKSLGLQTDDVVTSVNGMPLTNPAKIMEVYKNMGNTSSANLEILRGGNVITVDVVLQ